MLVLRKSLLVLLVLSLITCGLGSAAASAQGTTTASPRLGLEGYCPVCIVEARKWMKGSPEHAVEYDGQVYYFPGADQQQMFLENPGKYVPALGGDCTVCFAKMQKRVAGNIRSGAFYKNRLYLFPSDKERAMFKMNPASFAGTDLALGGACAVCLTEMEKQVPGKPEFTAHHNGLRYQFPSDKERAMFLANPAKYEVKQERSARTGTSAASASLTVVGTAGCAGCEHGVHPLGAPDTLGLAVNSTDGQVYIVEDAHRLYPALYEGRFDGHQLRVDGEVIKRQGKFVWLKPASLQRVQ